ncbi:ATP-binding sensor histidine kinase [Marinoscillum furvescens]|uniref:histidine kinase n=1 Tax=Marinoscillum furvescens DSM 4134 TaxID=1122208 RepID=A0A3D9L3F7_MARFU|nr:ATP-binding sensor histidine kinase [Marinoscillum furvescens]RED99824.1 putative ATPase [Marinoscillum furvescens DSM 4134]
MQLLDKALKIAEGFNSSIYQLSDDTYGQEVILKVMKEEFNAHPHSSQLYNEHKYLKNVRSKGIRAALDLIEANDSPILVLEYFDGLSLKEWRKNNSPTFIDCLKIAIQIGKSLHKIHTAHNLIHRDISAHNILINDQLETILIDFGLAINVDIKLNIKGMSDQLLGTLPYISPEQTGRVNHAVDYRSDLYSFGVVLYELFTGKLPFESNDPLELIHSHLAIAPESPTNINPQIPEVFSQIILKLLEKDMELRYQSAQGLLNDLQKCLDQAALKVEIQGFELAQNDESGKFRVPSKIYGRDQEISQLLNAISTLGSGKREITLVAGKSGTGKTSLIYEIHKPITQKRGFFIKGKHQQFQKDRPYQAISQAIQSFISLLLSENEEKLARWKSLLQNALGEQGKLLTDLIPNLELIVGKQKKLPVLGINEAQNRFNYIFTQFVKVLATREHPLVLFIDDLQWSDNASLKLLRQLITDPDLDHFYFIGAYRDNEVDHTHPLHLIFGDLEKEGISSQLIKLDDLNFEDTHAMVSDTFSVLPEKSRALAHIVHTKTAGNPFFINQFLKSIYEEKLVWYEFPQNGHKGAWQWDLQKLEASNFTENVVAFMVEKLRKMPAGIQRQLTLGACIGDRFDLKTLQSIQQVHTESAIMEDLWHAVVEQLLIVEESHGDAALVHHLQPGTDDLLIFRFAHDRIRQAAYELIPENEKAKAHQGIGELLLANTNESWQEQHVFSIVNQLNLGIPKPDRGYRIHLATLNYSAGKKAAATVANELACKHFNIALDVLQTNDWSEDHQLLFDIHLAAMESHFILAEYDEMERIGNLLLRKAKNKHETLQTHNIFVQSYIAQSKHIELIDYGVSILKKNGIRLTTRPQDHHILLGFLKTKLRIGSKKPSFFKELPRMEDAYMELLINTMSSISTASYHNYPKLFPLIIFKNVQLSLKHGNCMESIPFYGGYGTILCGVMGEYDAGYEFGKLSLELMENTPDYRPALPKTMVIFYGFIHHWKKPLRDALAPYEEAYLTALELGDAQYAASAAFLKACWGLLSGIRIDDLLEDATAHLEKMPSFNQESYLLYMQIVMQGIHALKDTNKPAWPLEGSFFSSKEFGKAYKKELQEDGTANFHLAYNQMYLNFLFGNYNEALEGSQKTLRLLSNVTSTIYVATFHFYDALIRLRIYLKSPSPKLLRQAKSSLKKLKKWANHAPENFLHKYELVEAEYRSATKSTKPVKELYASAITHAKEGNYLNELALAHECAGRHYQRNYDEPMQAHHLNEGLRVYQKWGATAKVKTLKEEFPYLGEPASRKIETSFTEASFSYGSISGNNLLDLSSVLKAASTISSEIQLNKAIPTLLEIITQNAGAQSGAFFLNENDELILAAISSVDEGASMVPPIPLSDSTETPHTVVNYVRRTHHTVLLDEPVSDERFQKDEYLLAHTIESLLCMPIVHQQKLLGVIYLENRLTRGSFTAERTDLLSLLSGQIAITLHNAILYDTLEQKVAERTTEIEKQKEKLHRQNRQLTELNDEKDFLISVVSHDLRNPLHLIKGYINLMQKEQDKAQVKEYMDHVVESSNRMDDFIKRILNVSAINTGDLEVNYIEVQMDKLLQKEFEAFEQQAKEKNITYKIQLNLTHLTTAIDTGYFNQIISNLISNAIKYTQPGGEVEVKLEMLEGGDYYRISVIDNGQGISSRDQKLLFSKFQKLSAIPTGGEDSTGLGLAIVKKYVEAMEGHIWCESEYEEGSNFFVEFPVER